MNNIFYSLGANIASKSIIFLLNIIGFRTLEIEEYGVLSLILAMAATVGVFANMGASVAITNVVSKNRGENLSKVFINFNYLLSILLSFILSIVVYLGFVDNIEGVNNYYIFLFLFLFTLFSANNAISEAVLSGFYNFKRIFLNNFFNFLLFLPLILIFTLKMGLLGGLLSLILYRLFLSLFNFYSASKLIKSNNKIKYKKYMNKVGKLLKDLTLPIVLSSFLVAPIIGFSFKIISSQEFGLEYLGYFSIVYQLYLVSIFVPNSLTAYFVSRFSRNNVDVENDIKVIAKYNFIFSLLIIVFLYIFKGLFLYLIGQNNIVISNNYNIMLVVIFFFCLNSVFSSYWPSVNKAWFGLYFNLIWAAVLLGVCYILAINNVEEALAYAFLASYFILTFVQTIAYVGLNYAKK